MMKILAPHAAAEQKIRLCFAGLIFSFMVFSCNPSGLQEKPVSIVWENNKAIGISIPRELVKSIETDSIRTKVFLRLAKPGAPAILGDYTVTDNEVLFKPAIPFTRGLSYELLADGRLINEILVPTDGNAEPPSVVAAYPSGDTVPENLLKFYIEFSQPMQEGEALKHIALIKGNDTAKAVFLDLEPELWNNSRTILTLWLDPGRIKRDLQPNKTLGPPLIRGEKCQLLIKNDWRNTEGVALGQPFRKDFVVGTRDSLSPNPSLWTIDVPQSGSIQTLQINFPESLDYALLNNTIHVIDNSGKEIVGDVTIKGGERGWSFKPSISWQSGIYTVKVDPILEDNAGNNLDRLFDTDLTQKEHLKKNYSTTFLVK